MATRSTPKKKKAKVRTTARTPKRQARVTARTRPSTPTAKEWGVVNVAPEVFQDALRHPETVFVPLRNAFDQDGFEAQDRRLIVRDKQDGRLAVGKAIATEPHGITLGTLWRLPPEYRLAQGEYLTGAMVVLVSPNIPPKAKFIVDRMR
jgi:hypothetical protein